MSDKMQMTRERPARICCRPIRDADLGPVTELLVEGFPGRSAADWARGMQRLAQREVPAPYPRFGYLLEVDDRPVGVILLIFSRQRKAKGSHVRCHTSSWYVKDLYQGYASFLSKVAVRHKEVTYVNISPGIWTRPIIEAQGFTRYACGQVVALPALSPGVAKSCVREFHAGEAYGPTLSEEERDMLTAHLDYGCLAYVVMEKGKANPFVFLPRRIYHKMVPALQLIYCRDIRDFVRLAGPLGRALARRGKLLFCLDAAGPLPGLVGKYFPGRGYPKYFKGTEPPRIGDLTYSEMVLLP